MLSRKMKMYLPWTDSRDGIGNDLTFHASSRYWAKADYDIDVKEREDEIL